MKPLSAMLVIGLIYAVGDIVSSKTKAFLSMMFVAAVIFLVGFWVGLPPTLFDDSKLVPVAMTLIAVLMVHMGSMLKLKDLKDEWKTVIVALLALVAVAVSLYFLGPLVMKREQAVVAIGPISGGVVSTMIVSEGVKAKGLDASLGVFATLLLVLQSFIGIPVASFCLKREASKALKAFRDGGAKDSGAAKKGADPEVPSLRLIPALPKALQTPFVLLAKTILVAWLAVTVAGLFKNVVHPYIFALVFGIIFYEIGFIEHKVLDKGNSGGLALFIMLVPIFMNLAKATPQMVVSLIVPMLLVFVISVIGLFVVSLIIGRILKYSWELSLAIGATCMFGFPGTFIISQEVATSQSSNQEEKEYLLKRILPKMLVAGFTTVTIGSVILAGVIVKFL